MNHARLVGSLATSTLDFSSDPFRSIHPVGTLDKLVHLAGVNLSAAFHRYRFKFHVLFPAS